MTFLVASVLKDLDSHFTDLDLRVVELSDQQANSPVPLTQSLILVIVAQGRFRCVLAEKPGGINANILK